MIALLRVDSRLLHGQVIGAWMPAVRAEGVVVVDAEAAASPYLRVSMELAFPEDLPVQVLAPAEVDWRSVATGPERLVLLVPDVAAAEDAVERIACAGGSVASLNLGNLHASGSRREIAPSVHLSSAELLALRRLAGRGVEVELRPLPGSPALDLGAIEERFAKGAS